jgi:signal transduction histidine kinase
MLTARPGLREVLVPAALALLGAVELYSMQTDGWGTGIAIEVLACALLVWRRRLPLIACTASPAVMAVLPWIGPQLDEPATPILTMALALFSLARWLPDLRGLVGVAVVAALLFVDYVAVDARAHNWSDAIFVTSLMAPPYVFGRITRRLAQQKDVLERNHELVRREAVRDERDRIARELHDVIAHSVSAMVVQTAAAQDLVRTDPDTAERVLEEVADTGRRALAETGRLLHVIRDDADELGLSPAPGLADLPALVDEFRASGLEVELHVGEIPPLPAGVDVSAYRIVQEALTNALRYGADRTAALHLSRTPDGLSIRASNVDGGRSSSGSGLGLLGMAERVSVLGGQLTHGVRDGRFVLDATLPTGPS